MTQTEIIAVPAINGTVSFPSEGQKIKNDLLALSREIDLIGNDAQRDEAIAAAQKLKGLDTEAKKAHEAAREPFNQASKAIIDHEKDFRKEIQSENARLNNLVATYNEEQRQKAIKAEEERQRIVREAEEKARKEQEDAEKKAKELAEKTLTDKVPTAEEKAKLMSQQLDADDAAEKAAEARKQAGIQRQKAQEAALASKSTGGAQRMEWLIEVTDIHALYAMRPDCVKMEPILTQIKIILDAGKTLAGVKAVKVPKFAARGVSNQFLK